MTIFIFSYSSEILLLNLKRVTKPLPLRFLIYVFIFLRTLKNKNYQKKKATSDAMLCSVGDGASWECGLDLVSHFYFSLIRLGWGHFFLGKKHHLGSPSAFPFNNWKPLFIIYVKLFFSGLLSLTFPLIRILGIPWLFLWGILCLLYPRCGS